MRACVIFNPVAKGDKARHLRQTLEQLGDQCSLKPTWGPGTGRAAAAEAVGEGFRTVIAAGGDGTINEVLNGIGEQPQGFAQVRLGVLPIGTVNVFAREHGLPQQVLPAWEVIRCGREKGLDLAVAEFMSPAGPASRFFVQMAGAGLDARAVELVQWSMKKKIGYLAYLLAGLRALREPQPMIQVQCAEFNGLASLVLMGNGRLYGGDFRVFPQASPVDGLLDLAVFPQIGLGDVPRCLWALFVRHALPTNLARWCQTESVRLSSDSRVPLELDGELAGCLPATVTLRKQALRLLIP